MEAKKGLDDSMMVNKRVQIVSRIKRTAFTADLGPEPVFCCLCNLSKKDLKGAYPHCQRAMRYLIELTC